MIVPLIHRVLVKIEKLEDVDPVYAAAARAGLHFSMDEDVKRQQAAVDRGTVIAIGPTAFRDFGVECPIQVGDVIAFAKYSGKSVVDPDDRDTHYVLLNDEDVVCVVKEQ